MATDQTSNMRRTPKKSSARAKVKRPETEQEANKSKRKAPGTPSSSKQASSAGASTSTKSRTSANAKSMDALHKQEGKDRAKKIGIAIFAVVMALSMMLPSLVTIVSNMRPKDADVQQTTSADASSSSSATDSSTSTDTSSSSSTTDSSATSDTATSDTATSETATSDTATSDTATSDTATSESSSSTSETSTTVASLDADYQVEVSALEKRLADDPKNLAALLNLGKQYMSWAYSVSYYGGSEEGAVDHAHDLFDKAIGYYDQYLALNDSNAVKVDRALCQFYAGDYDAAQAALEKLTKDAPDYGPAWANLGLVYESMWNTESAQDAYKKAAEADPNDEYGARSFANRRLAAMNESAVTEGQDVVEPNSTPTTGLTQTLTDASGIGF